MIDTLGALVFLFTSFLYGIQCFTGALCIIAMLILVRANLLTIFAIMAGTTIVILNYSHFNYLEFIHIPNQSISKIESYGIWHTLQLFIKDIKNKSNPNIGQLYILLPYLLMMVFTTWKHARNKPNPKKQNHKLTPKLEAEYTTQKTYIHSETNQPYTQDSIYFGYDIINQQSIHISHKELNTHMYINGASGSGKTVAMLNFVIEAAQKKIPLIYIDGKGSTDLEEKIAKIASQHNRVFKTFSLSPNAILNTSAYDFLGSGTFTEKKNRIMELFIQADGAGTSYFQDNLETFINRVFMVIHQNKLRIDLFRFLSLISNINDLIELAEEPIILEDNSKLNLKPYFEEIRNMKPEHSPRIRIITKLDPFIHSSYGHLFNIIDKPNTINLKKSIQNNEIILFLFDASAFALDTTRVAKMVISDINATFAEFGKEKTPIKTFCCFDEFKSYETDAISKTISLHRSNGLHAIIGTQSLNLINKDIGNGILSNCQTHLIMASADADAELFAEEFGKTNKIETTTRIKVNTQEVSDLSTKKIQDYKINKQDIKDIRVNTGQGYLHQKAANNKPTKIQVAHKA